MNRSVLILVLSLGVLVCTAVGIRFLSVYAKPRAVVISSVATSTTVMPTATSTLVQPQEINPNLPSQPAAVISEVTNTALVERDAHISFLHQGDVLQEGDIVRVGGSSGVSILWPHYGRTLLDQNSVIQIRNAFESTDRERLNVRFDLLQGKVWTRFGHPVDIDSRFEIRAGSDAINVSGMASFGVERTESLVRVMSLSPGVVMRQLVDQSPSLLDRINGASEGLVEQTVGEPVVLPSKSVVENRGGVLSAPRILTLKEQRDSFMLQGDIPLTAQELNFLSN